MNFTKHIEEIKKLMEDSNNSDLIKRLEKVLKLLDEIENKDLTNAEKVDIEKSIRPYLENIKTQSDINLNLKKLRKTLSEDFGFVPSDYFLTLGIGIGIAIGSALGISFGAPFENGIVLGPIMGSGIGLVGGLLIGMYLDKNKESENRNLKNL